MHEEVDQQQDGLYSNVEAKVLDAIIRNFHCRWKAHIVYLVFNFLFTRLLALPLPYQDIGTDEVWIRLSQLNSLPIQMDNVKLAIVQILLKE